jgi:FG-GAP-like repeat
VTVPKGAFTNAAKIVHKSTITAFSSSGFGSATVIGTQTIWFAPGVGPVKRTIEIQDVTNQVMESSTEELTDHFVKSFGAPPVSYPSNGLAFKQPAVGDLNGDGRNDVVVIAGFGPTVPIFYQTSQGQLSPFVLLDASSTMTTVHRIAVGDLNSDGKTDLVLTGSCASCGSGFQGRVLIRYQHPTNGTLLSGQAVAIASDVAASAAIGDINADGRNDLVVMNLQGRLSIYYQLANGSLAPEIVYDKILGDLTVEVHIADMDNDGDQDIVVQNFLTSQGQFSIIKQNSAVTPGVMSSTPETYTASGAFRSFALGDINADGRSDVVVSDYSNFTLQVFLQNSTGTLNASITIPPGAVGLPADIKIADIDGDGRNDLVSDTGQDMLVYLQAPDHSFKNPIANHYQSQYSLLVMSQVMASQT